MVHHKSSRSTIFLDLFPGLQMTDADMDERVTVLEENGGSNGEDKTIISLLIRFVLIF